MKFEELIILLPCHSLEDFPLHHTGADAESLLACWSAMWHPALLASAGKMPTWKRVESPPEVLAGRLLMVPSVSEALLPTGLVQRAKEEQAHLVRKLVKRPEVLSAVLAGVDGGSGGVDDELAGDFLALGYCYLQVELLTRQMRYSSSLDQVFFEMTVIAAAQAAMRSEVVLAKEKLQACFDLLAEERGRYYPVDAFLIDITLVAPTTLGASLRRELANATPGNVLLSGETLTQLAAQEPESLAALRDAVAQKRVGLIGGEYEETRLPLLPVESLLGGLERGRAGYEQHLGIPPRVYGRRRFGYVPMLPQILARMGFIGGLHVALDGGVMPSAAQAKIKWKGSGDEGLDGLARNPRDANDPATFLNLAIKIGESMDADHVATQLLAHWPGQAAPWHDDLRRIARYGKALGRFVTVEEYFETTAAAGQTETFGADQYGSQYLREAIVRQKVDIISGPRGAWQRNAQTTAFQAWSTLTTLVAGRKTPPSEAVTAAAAVSDESTSAAAAELTTALEAATSAQAEAFAAVLPRAKTTPGPGYLVLNPSSYVRRMGIEVPNLPELPASGRPLYAIGESHGRKHAVVDVPPMGFVWLAAGTHPLKQSRLSEPLAEEGVLRNEYFELLFNRETGTLRSVHSYGKRGNRLSQQLAYRSNGLAEKSGDENDLYSVMAADSLEVTANSHALGEITARGRLLDRSGKKLAGFKQVYQLWRGSRVLILDLELELVEEPKADPWNSYYCLRFAWHDEAANLYRGMNEARQGANSQKLEAPLYFEIEGVDERTSILTGGLPFHRRVGPRKLDSLLVVRGETCRKFRVGIGLDVAYPAQEALALLSPPQALFASAPPPAPNASGWLFHLDAKNVVATHWEPVLEADKPVGFRVRLLETAGRPAKLAISALRPLATANRLNFLGAKVETLAIGDGKAQLEMAAGELTQVEGRW